MITIVLQEIENEGNLGAIIRSMGNFDLNKLILINPQCDYHSEEVLKRAKNSKKVQIKVLDSLDKLKLDCLIGTTAKLGTQYNIQRLALTPDQVAEKIKERKNIGILFGRESSGLTNEELEKCDFVINIPSSQGYKTLNISHAATIIFYELFKSKPQKTFEYIDEQDKRVLLNLIKEVLNEMKFSTEPKRETQYKVWKNIIGKSFLTKREFFALCGFLKKVKATKG